MIVQAGPDTLARLLAARARPSRLVIGLLSGTSADAADAALCEITGAGADAKVRLVAYLEAPFSPPLQREVLAANAASAAEIAALHFRLGEVFAQAALEVAARAGVRIGDVDLIASHGQTVSHQPPSPGHPGATLQIGEAAVIAERTGIPVVCDFRVRDMAAGGEGAPLVPLADWILFRQPGRVRALQNVGGISNVTAVTEALGDVRAFDNAPGNMVLDAAARAAFGEPFDRSGAHAARGRVDEAVVAELLAHSFLAAPPPKSTGREAFGASFVDPLLARFAGRGDDLLATLTTFVARAIAGSYGRFLGRRPDEVLVSGGGAENPTLLAELARAAAPIPVGTLAQAGMDPAAKEAVAFALLGNEALFAHAGNVPAATGAAGPRVLGKLVL